VGVAKTEEPEGKTEPETGAESEPDAPDASTEEE
jgi:hypothetical protein